MDKSFPALATGGRGTDFTVTFTVAVDVAPLLSVIFNSKVYTPSLRSLTTVVLPAASAIVPAEGPEIFVHRYDTIVPEEADDFVPSSVMVFTGS